MAQLHKEKHNGKAHVGSAANDLLKESKKLAHEWLEESSNRAKEVQHQAKAYSDKLSVKVKDNPLTSVVVAAGIGFLLSSLLRK